MIRFLFLLFFQVSTGLSATIAIIDTGFDLDHDYLQPKILKKETDEEAIDYYGWDFFDNSHLKTPVVEDKSSLKDILRYRSLKAKGHRQGLSMKEFDWYKIKSADKVFMEKVKLFKKHSHGTFVAGIALREGENINIFPIRGLNIPASVVAVEATGEEGSVAPIGKNSEEKFHEEIKQSLNRVSRKFSKICNFVARKKIEIVNASYGITYKNLMTKFRERYLELTGKEISEPKLKLLVDDYFQVLYERGEKVMRKHHQVLFVFSAGNSGLDNDIYHHYPSRIKVPNAISVGAMNGEYLATFSNFGSQKVDIGAPGVAILSLVPKVYSQDGSDLYSPSSGTSMAAPYVSNLAAQILNTNPYLSPSEVKRIILETGETKQHLKTRLASSSIVSNQKAMRAALLSRDIVLDQAISLGRSDVIPMEDKISIGFSPAVSPEEVQKKLLDSVPSVITPQEVDDEVAIESSTRSESSSLTDQEKEQPDNSAPPVSTLQGAPETSVDPAPSSQIEEQVPKPSAETPASSSPPQSLPQENQSQVALPSLPESSAYSLQATSKEDL